MGMKHTDTFASKDLRQNKSAQGGNYSHIIHKIMKNGMNRMVRSVIIASKARPTESIPTKLTIQKITKPASPNLKIVNE